MTTGHPDERDLISYVDGELSGELRAAIDAHAASCASCADRIRELAAARASLPRDAFRDLPRKGSARLVPDFPRRQPGDRSLASTKRLVGALTALAVVLAVVFAVANADGCAGSSVAPGRPPGGAVPT